jgi:hypothetical protein
MMEAEAAGHAHLLSCIVQQQYERTIVRYRSDPDLFPVHSFII